MTTLIKGIHQDLGMGKPNLGISSKDLTDTHSNTDSDSSGTDRDLNPSGSDSDFMKDDSNEDLNENLAIEKSQNIGKSRISNFYVKGHIFAILEKVSRLKIKLF